MKMLNCPECGLTITTTHKKCPKCRVEIKDVTHGDDNQAKKPKKNASQRIKEEMIDAVIRSEANAHATTVDPTSEESMLAAVVEAEALVAIEEEKEENEEQTLCEKCQTPIPKDQHICKNCELAASEKIVEEVPKQVVKSKSSDQSNKWIAAAGYVIFFLPLLSNYYKESAFVKFHAKQAASLFIASIVLFLGLLLLRNTMIDWFVTSPEHLSYVCTPLLYEDPFCVQVQPEWHHGHGVAGGVFYHYLKWMIFVLHFMPFVWMIIGIANALYVEKRALPIIGHFGKNDSGEFEQLNLFK